MPEHYRPFTSSLRSRLLILTFIFVMGVSVFVYLPSIATFRQDYIETRLENAQIAVLALEEAPNNMVSPDLEQRLLRQSGVIAIIVRREDKSLVLGFDVMPDEVNATYDLRNPSLGMLIMEAFDTLEAGGNRVIRVIGDPMLPGTRLLEVTMDEAGLYRALANYSNNILVLAILTSLFTGILVYLALHWMLVRPMRRVKDRIVAFRRQPEAVPKRSRESRRPDEIGLVERELVRMQDELRQNLRQKSHLAALGEAVAKINHDLRNILATAQLASDALQRVDHPGVQRVSRRLVSAVSRAVALCESTIRHGKADDPLPEKRWSSLLDIVRDVAMSLGILDADEFTFDCAVDDDLQIYADPEQLHRVLLNLCRNAHEVQGAGGRVAVSARRDSDGTVHITVTDSGPGIPEHVRPSLFKAFSSARAGGTGLGLATARDIVLAHGGQIGLEETGPDGTTFVMCIPGEEADD
ncbi:HAMP domain-containing sensor histidine kinase [Kordiimonas aestuarii]|uniref:HAMP domain-containing sensor histidine kinase n=1 Tax=Kordiimonas aestuarii TaxID=1005925 RepID=UPI0021CFEE9F|nr:HAMP domain-containing sensor histidine kinase [Kordiimonas aestuarii]